MILNLIFWILCLLINFGLLAIVFYALLCLTDLEVDQMDPFVATANINRWILPEFVLQAVLSLLLLLTGHWILFLLAVPLTCYHAMLFIRRQHLIDVTEVFRNLNTDKKRRMIKLGVYMIFFTIFIFRFVLTSVHNYPSFSSRCKPHVLVRF
ncbi:PREDICTED: protein cornichon homolog 1-like isoform X1 [Populus euphratica]|uniref:Protein cornichon homolog 1-like isoform X1 n=1 Tax=Populus euphratica TaxID=75702 RepID=A0AAJ6XIZ2_POPEU|nr:PREDICTED: protein cornichon homolog 1-like isoform X1 [Populus euphratica]